MFLYNESLPKWHSGKESACQAGDLDSIPGLGRFPREENGNSLQNIHYGKYHGQRSLAGYIGHGIAKNQTHFGN